MAGEKIAFSEAQLKSLRAEIKERHLKKGLESMGLNILIVEDHPFFGKILLDSLPKQYNYHMAKNGQEALEHYSNTAHDIVFLDIQLPDTNGHDIAALIKEYDPESFIVMVTGNNYAEDVAAATRNKVQGFITKPYNKQKILDAINSYLKRLTKSKSAASGGAP